MDLYRHFNHFSWDPLLDGRHFFDEVNAGREGALDVLNRFCRQVAMQITNLTILLDLERVAIGGGISRQPILLETIKRCLDELYDNPGPYFDAALPKPEIVLCHYGSEANQVGAYLYFADACGK